jgi:sucrose phosphorylase
VIGQRERVHFLTAQLYGRVVGEERLKNIVDDLVDRIGVSAAPTQTDPAHPADLWSQRDVALITYGDSIVDGGSKPLKVLRNFCETWLGSCVTWVHILPFFPWTSDDGFSVLDYSSVNQALGDWNDISDIATDYRLMADLVLNHCSSRSAWFENFKQGIDPGRGYFFTKGPSFDVSRVVRPRTSDLTMPVVTSEGEQQVWCTFSHDQVDFDFSNPDVLLEFTRIIRLYLDRGVRIFRLDAVAFTWKRSGTTCINLPEAHDLVRLLRALIEWVQPDAIIITETNVPNIENLAYFGQRDEAHCIYNFALPPLLIHTLVEADSSRITRWLMSMPPAILGTTYFNFLASHDGIGLRPVEGLLSEGELDSMIDQLQENGALLSWREHADGTRTVYEVNVSLFDALKQSGEVVDRTLDRMILAHAILLGLEGVPAIYLHSFVATSNDLSRVENTGHNRAINRHQWALDELTGLLNDAKSQHARCLQAIKQLINMRQGQPAFHPNATQFTLNCGRSIFGFWRQSPDRVQSIFCLYNVTPTSTSIAAASLNLVGSDSWRDLISGETVDLFSEDPTIELAPYQAIWLTNTMT